jgi:DNA replication protein DnaC
MQRLASSEFGATRAMGQRMMALIEAARTGVVMRATTQCAQHGDFLAFQVGDEQSGCPECAQERADIRAQEQNETEAGELRAARIVERLSEAIPRRFARATFEGYEIYAGEAQIKALALTRAYARRISDVMRSGSNLAMLGNAGNGKTHLSMCILTAAIEAGFTGCIVTASEIFGLTKGFNEESELQRLASFDLLIIDEIGLQKGSAEEEVRIGTLANKRYNARRPTVWLSNLGREEFKRLIGMRTFERIAEDGGLCIQCTWDSYRMLNPDRKTAESIYHEADSEVDERAAHEMCGETTKHTRNAGGKFPQA